MKRASNIHPQLTLLSDKLANQSPSKSGNASRQFHFVAAKLAAKHAAHIAELEASDATGPCGNHEWDLSNGF